MDFKYTTIVVWERPTYSWAESQEKVIFDSMVAEQTALGKTDGNYARTNQGNELAATRNWVDQESANAWVTSCQALTTDSSLNLRIISATITPYGP